MSLDVRRIGERLLTPGEGTLERLLARVDTEVPLERGSFWERLTALRVRTHVRLLAGVLEENKRKNVRIRSTDDAVALSLAARTFFMCLLSENLVLRSSVHPSCEHG
jgi:hypothetical protein